MKFDYKIILMAVIVFCSSDNLFSEQDDNLNNIKSENNITKFLHQQEHRYEKVKTAITNSFPKYKDVQLDHIISQMYNRFMEKTEYNGTSKIAGQPVDGIAQEIQKLDDDGLNIEKAKNFSLGLLKFMAEGCLTYGNVSPDDALEIYNQKVTEINEKKLDYNSVQKSRQKDIDEINAREMLQDLQREYNEIMERRNNNIDPSTGEYLQYLGKIFNDIKHNKDVVVQNALIDAMIMSNADTIDLEKFATSESIGQYMKDLPKDRGKLVNNFRKILDYIKNSKVFKFFKRNKNKQQSSNEKINNNKEKDSNKSANNIKENNNNEKTKKEEVNNKEKVNEIKTNEELSNNEIFNNKLSADEMAEIIINNSNLLD